MTAVPVDYDRDPERFRTGRRVVQAYGTGDVHQPVAARLANEGLVPVLDLGCGDGALAEAMGGAAPGAAAIGWVGLDASATMLAGGPRPAIRADATALPVADSSLGAVCALWMLYHLEDPTAVAREAHRALRPGGLFVACTSARDDSPELTDYLGAQPASSFDAEEAEAIVAEVFDDVEADRWDGPYVHLPDRAAVGEYLVGRCIDPDRAAGVAAAVRAPLDVTKRGVVVWARKG